MALLTTSDAIRLLYREYGVFLHAGVVRKYCEDGDLDHQFVGGRFLIEEEDLCLLFEQRVEATWQRVQEVRRQREQTGRVRNLRPRGAE